jgi:amidase
MTDTDRSLRRALNISEEYDSEYFEALAREHDISRTRGIDAALKTHRLDALVLPAQAMTTTPSSKGSGTFTVTWNGT